jgi:hypothetical protein
VVKVGFPEDSLLLVNGLNICTCRIDPSALRHDPAEEALAATLDWAIEMGCLYTLPLARRCERRRTLTITRQNRFRRSAAPIVLAWISPPIVLPGASGVLAALLARALGTLAPTLFVACGISRLRTWSRRIGGRRWLWSGRTGGWLVMAVGVVAVVVIIAIILYKSVRLLIVGELGYCAGLLPFITAASSALSQH